MGVVINTNVSSATLVRAIKTATADETSTITKLASGKRINRAADDAAGLTINEKLNTKLRGITKAQGNIGDALGVIQNTYGGLTKVMEHLQKIRELMVKAANGTNGVNELNDIQSEIHGNVAVVAGMRNQVYPYSGGTNGNLDNGYGAEVFQGAIPTAFKKDFQVGPDPNDVIKLDFSNSISLDNCIDISVGAAAGGALASGASGGLWDINVGGTVKNLMQLTYSLPSTKSGTLNDLITH